MSAFIPNLRTILLTYDYELFFKRSGTVERCLLEPTERILELSRQYSGMPSTFFVDALHLIRCRYADYDSRKDYDNISDQLRRIVKEGHRIELHLHPHWLDAERQGGAWIFPTYNRYRLHDVSVEQMNKLFLDGVRILEEIVSPVESNYRIRAFRAGGWCIQPSGSIVAAMRIAGLNLDSTIGPGCSASGLVHSFDFGDVREAKPYFFSDNVTRPDSNGLNLELPISTLSLGFFDRLARRLEMLLSPDDNVKYGDGEGMQVSVKSKNKVGEILSRFRRERTFLSLDGLSVMTVKRAIRNNENYMCFVSHPKLMSNHSLKIIHLLAQNPRNEFVTVAGAAERLGAL